MIKKVLSLLLCVVMAVTMLPMISMPVYAEDPDLRFSIAEKFYYPQSDSNPDTIPFSSFNEGFGDWSSIYCSPETKNFTAMFVVFKMDIELPAYTRVKVDCRPKAYASSVNFTVSGNFGLELFYFENYGEWENLVFKTGTSDDQSSAASLEKQAKNSLTKTEIELESSQHYKEFDNSNGEATTGSVYYGILGYFRETGLFKHQLSLGWDFDDIKPSIVAKSIYYDANGGTGTADSVVTNASSSVTLHSGEGFSKANSAFLGWATSSSGIGTTYASGETYSAEYGAKLYAQYLTYDLSNCSGTVNPGSRGEGGIAIAGGDGLYKTGHTFKGWKSSGGESYAPGDIYSGYDGITLSPVFEPNKYDVTLIQEKCTVTLNQNPATYGTRVEILTVPDIGYQLDGYEVYKTDDPSVTVPLTSANTFTQPEYPVTVKVNLSKIPYGIEKYPSENGNFTVSHETAGIDDVVEITTAPDIGFEVENITVTRTDTGEELAVDGGKFTMVPSPVKVAVVFKNSIFAITKADTTNGSFTLNCDSTIMGDTVVVNAVPDEGYQVKSITAYQTDDKTVTLEVTGGSFVMPPYPVTVAVEFEPALLDIFKSSGIENGDITLSRTEAYLSETVSVEATPARGYTLDTITVYKTGDETVTVEVTDGSFVMPSYPVTVHATFKKIDYVVSVENASNEKGSFTVSKHIAQMGDTVTVDITCAEGWAIRGILLTDGSGKSTYVDKTFTMPADNVTVSVAYMVIPTYIITIPATVELGGEPMTVAITNAVMEEGVNLKVSLETDFTAQTLEGAEKPFTINGGTVQNGDVILTVEGGGTPLNPKQGSTQLSLEWDEAYQYSGNYRATLAFTIKVEDAGYDQTE